MVNTSTKVSSLTCWISLIIDVPFSVIVQVSLLQFEFQQSKARKEAQTEKNRKPFRYSFERREECIKEKGKDKKREKKRKNEGKRKKCLYRAHLINYSLEILASHVKQDKASLSSQEKLQNKGDSPEVDDYSSPAFSLHIRKKKIQVYTSKAIQVEKSEDCF